MENAFLLQLAIIVNIIVAIVTFGLVIATFMVARATKLAAEATEKTIEAQYKPWVVMYIKPNWLGRYVDLYVKNVGYGPAYDISFGLPEYFPNPMEWVDPKKSDGMPKNWEDGPIRNGMSFLAAGSYWRAMWGDYADLMKGLEGKPLEVIIKFKTAKGTYESSRCVLDIRDFEGFETTNFEGQTILQFEKQTKSLERLASTIEKIEAKLK